MPDRVVGEKLRVLVVDDKAEMRQAFTNLLYFEDGLKVIGTANDGADAVEKFRQLKPDVILMDIEMPVLDGVEATRQIRQADAETIIIAVSSEIRYKTKAQVAGANAFLLKPFQAEDFVAAVQEASNSTPVES